MRAICLGVGLRQPTLPKGSRPVPKTRFWSSTTTLRRAQQVPYKNTRKQLNVFFGPLATMPREAECGRTERLGHKGRQVASFALLVRTSPEGNPHVRAN